MGWFSAETPESDVETGRKAVRIFQASTVGYPGYSETLDSLIAKVGGANPQFFLEGVGLAIRSIGMSDGQVEDAMESLAAAYQGRIPRREAFTKALSDRVSNPTAGDYIAATPQVALESAGDLVKGAQQLGDSLIAIGSTLNQFGPILIVAAIIFIGYARTRQYAGK